MKTHDVIRNLTKECFDFFHRRLDFILFVGVNKCNLIVNSQAIFRKDSDGLQL